MEPVQFTPPAAALFAAEQIAKPGRLDGIHIAGSAAKVSTADLAPKIFAFTFLHLRDRGAITLQVTSKKVLFVTSTWVQTQLTGTHVDAGAVANALLARVVNGKSVKDAICAWYGRDYTNPWPLVIQFATQEAIDSGYLVASEQGLGGKIGSFFTGALPATVATGKEAEVKTIGTEAAAKWAAYGAQDAALLEQLLKDCKSAIQMRQSQDTPVT